MLRILLVVTLSIVAIAAQTESSMRIEGRVTDRYGRAIKMQPLRVQANFCAPDYQFTPVYEYYGYTNTFGYYGINARATCQSYSVRILDGRRNRFTDFFPWGYYWLYRLEDVRPRVVKGNNFKIV